MLDRNSNEQSDKRAQGINGIETYQAGNREVLEGESFLQAIFVGEGDDETAETEKEVDSQRAVRCGGRSHHCRKVERNDK